MAAIAQLSKNIRRRGRQVENAGTEMVRRSSKAALREVVRNTPGDVGTARSNWRVGIGAPTRATIAAYAPGRNIGTGESANASRAIAVGVARINAVKGVRGVGLKTAVFISNNLSYIRKLNAGSSSQAPAGFIESAFSAASRELRGFRIFTG